MPSLFSIKRTDAKNRTKIYDYNKATILNTKIRPRDYPVFQKQILNKYARAYKNYDSKSVLNIEELPIYKQIVAKIHNYEPNKCYKNFDN